MNTQSLDKLQSSGMGEGWSDFFAVTIQNFFRLQEKFVVGDWVVNNPAGIRRKPYDDNFPFGFGDLHSFSIDPQTGQQEVHEIGELWCAILLRMTRRIRTALGNDQSGYRLAWQIVVDGLKLTPANPTFIETRDAILRALDDLKKTNRITADVHKLVRRASWEAFAHLGLGTGAAATDADTVEAGDITADDKLPADL
jgi:extracellular elastinolytic metalloproteinase